MYAIKNKLNINEKTDFLQLQDFIRPSMVNGRLAGAILLLVFLFVGC